MLVLVPAAGVAAETVRERPRITHRCPANALPLRKSDIPALRRTGLALAPHGVERFRNRVVADYRNARAKARFPTFYTGYVRNTCPARLVRRVIGRTADVTVSYPRITRSASLSYSIFLVVRTPSGFVGWAQMH